MGRGKAGREGIEEKEGIYGSEMEGHLGQEGRDGSLALREVRSGHFGLSIFFTLSLKD